VTQIRPRLDEDLAAEVKAYGDSLRLNFNTTVRILLRIGLRAAPRDHDGVIAALKAASQEQDAGSTT
jgi:hypothetical protein